MPLCAVILCVGSLPVFFIFVLVCCKATLLAYTLGTCLSGVGGSYRLGLDISWCLTSRDDDFASQRNERIFVLSIRIALFATATARCSFILTSDSLGRSKILSLSTNVKPTSQDICESCFNLITSNRLDFSSEHLQYFYRTLLHHSYRFPQLIAILN